MERPNYIPTFSKALLAGALTGLAATVANLIYNLVFRSIVHYTPDEEFNFFSITLSSMLVLTLIGMLFFVFVKYMSSKAFVVTVSIIVIAVVCITAFLHADPNETAFYGNHGLIAGFVIISGIFACTLLPYLYNHSKLFL